jgi:ribosomal protein L37AE/L43A
MTSVGARCPACDGIGEPYGEVGSRMVFKCRSCTVRFKGPATEAIMRVQARLDRV